MIFASGIWIAHAENQRRKTTEDTVIKTSFGVDPSEQSSRPVIFSTGKKPTAGRESRACRSSPVISLSPYSAGGFGACVDDVS